MTFGPLKKRADIERSFSFSYKGKFQTDPVTSSSELAHTFSVSLGEAHGYGTIVFYPNLVNVPLWYPDRADTIISRSADGTFAPHSASDLAKKLPTIMSKMENENASTRGFSM